MSITYTWNVNTMDVAPTDNNLNNVVKVIHWRLTATDGTHIADSFSTLSLETPDSENFVEFDDLTEQEVIQWVESKVNVDNLKQGLQDRLAALANPPIITKQGPWMQAQMPVQPPPPVPTE